jgi:hypothetical protein
MNRDELLILTLLEDLQKISEKKKKLTDKEIAALKPPKDKITQADILSMRGVDLDEKRKRQKTDFDIGGEPDYRKDRTKKEIKKQSDLTIKYNNCKTEKCKDRIRKQIDKARSMEKIDESVMLTQHQLFNLINETIEYEKLAIMLEKVEELEEKKKRKKKKKKSGKSSKGLSAAVKKSLDKKADKRGLTRGSVYSEFRKGLAAYYTSGSRKGMSAHQWAHARVNSANPSKSWATVKKRKGGKKKKKQ